MDLTSESIQELNEQSTLSHQLEGKALGVVIDIGDFSFNAYCREPIMLLHGFPNTNYQWRADRCASRSQFLCDCP